MRLRDKSLTAVVGQLCSLVGMIALAWFGLSTGVRGLRYFVHFPSAGQLPWLLLPHIATGFLALVLGPWQFWPSFRMKYRLLHRKIGSVYVLSVVVSSALGLYLALNNPNLHFKAGLSGLAIAWMVTIVLAYRAIRQGVIQEHREWMILNYVLTWSFVTFRLGISYMRGLGYTPDDTLILVWLCWVPQLLLACLLLRLKSGDTSAQPQPAKIRI